MSVSRTSWGPLAAGLTLLLFLQPSPARDFQVKPASLTLKGNHARAQLLVTASNARGKVDERSADLTRRAVYHSANEHIALVSPTGRLLAVDNGEVVVTVTVAGATHSVPVRVEGIVARPEIGFADQVMPIIAKAGCNAGACHASQYGKGGFKLSVFGYAPEEDYRAIVRDGLGRRVNLLEPRESLICLKPTCIVPHGGGHRLQADSVDFQILQEWLAEGAPPPKAESAHVTTLHVTPGRRIGDPGCSQQLQVVADYSNGSRRDVTAWTKFDTMDEGVVRVSPDGLMEAVGHGQGAVLLRFDGLAELATLVVPYGGAADLNGWTDRNFVDSLAAKKFSEVGITPSPLGDDATFLRRACLDATGTLPTVEQATAFLDSKDPQKRRHLIDQLLGLTGDPTQDVHTNDYAAYWALKWSDLIRSNSAAIGEQGMWALYNWIKESFRENKPLDRFVRELITAKGSTFCNGPANYYRIASNPQDLAEATSQLFLGVRLGCAKCHHHPYERLSQADYYGFAAFFARVSNKSSQEFGIFGGETVILARADGEVANPRTGKIVPPTPLFGQPATDGGDRRMALAGWLTSPTNPYFARNIVNRYVAYLLGHGLVEPIDDMRATNVPSNPALLDALAEDFIKSGYNVKHLLSTLMNSRLYQLDSQPLAGNAADNHFYSHYHVKRLAAEPLLDAIDDATGVPTKFNKMPLGTKAIELPDAQYNNYFLKAFGKPRREAVCECERVSEPNLAQALHTLNGDALTEKIADKSGRVAQLVNSKKSADQVLDELYLAALSRRPNAEELAACKKLLAGVKDPRSFYEDLLWSLINSKHFLFVR
jgi:hypothetical protein